VAVELVTIEAVPIVRVGTYELSTGTHSFTEEDLRAAADALANDPAVKAPRIKIDSVEGALALDDMAHGGEPAFGYVDGLRVSENGQELLGDFHVPEGVRGAMEWAYPSLSVEGTPPGWTSATGRKHDLVITAVALLGVHWPGVTTLEDFSEFLANGPTIEKTVDAPEEVLATTPQRARRIAASLDQDLVGRRFYEGLESGGIELPDGVDSVWDLWIRSMRFDDAGKPYLKVTDESHGTLYRVDFKVSSSGVTFGDFVEVVEQDVPVAAGAPRPLAPLASWASRAESRAMAINPEEAHPMTDEQRRAFAAAFGLPEDATVEQVEAAAAEAATARQTEPVVPADEPVVEPVAEEVPVAARALPPGATIIDSQELEELRAGASMARELAQREADQARDSVIAAAIREGRFAPSRREHWLNAWQHDPEGTRTLLTASESEGGLAPNSIPVVARGAGPADTDTEAAGTGWFDSRFAGQEA
jgi:hypothetical protein